MADQTQDGRVHDGWWRRATRTLTLSGRRSGEDDPIAAIFWVTVSMALLAAIAALVRHASLSGLDSQVTFFWRNFFCVVLMLPLLAVRGRSLLTTSQPRLYILRVALSFVSMSSFFYALSVISIGQATAISFLSPLFGSLFAIVLLGEVVGGRRWMALLVGFAGALVMLRPWEGWVTAANSGGSAMGWGEAAALLSAMCVGIIGPLVKQLTSADDADRIVFITSLMMTPLSLLPALHAWSWPSGTQWLVLAALGLFAVVGHMTLVRGYVAADASLVMTFKFSRLPFAVVLGYLMFGETISLATWAGALVIFAAGVYIARREAQAHRARRSALVTIPKGVPPPPAA